MVERQYELLKRDRMKASSDDHAKPPPPSATAPSAARAAVVEEAESAPQPATATSAPPEAQNPPEVSFDNLRHCKLNVVTVMMIQQLFFIFYVKKIDSCP